MTCKSEIIEQIAEYTGEKYAEEWYQALFGPNSTDRAVKKYTRNIKEAELYHKMKSYSWKYDDVQAIFDDLSVYLAKKLGIKPKYYPEVYTHGINDHIGNNAAGVLYDTETFDVIGVELHFDYGGRVLSTANCQVGFVAHELIHVHQHIVMLSWQKAHRWWFKLGPTSARVHKLFALYRLIKPKPLLYWLNLSIYEARARVADGHYVKQLIEAEAIDTEKYVRYLAARAWRKFDEQIKMPAMS